MKTKIFCDIADYKTIKFFNNKSNGIYIDIGAYHPYRFSNTCLLHSRGWSGLNIDPNNNTTWKGFNGRALYIAIDGSLKDYVYFVVEQEYSGRRDTKSQTQLFAVTYPLEDAVTITSFSANYDSLDNSYPGYRVEFLDANGSKVAITGGAAGQVDNGVLKLDQDGQAWEDFSDLTSGSVKYIRFFRPTGTDNGDSSGATSGTADYTQGLSKRARLKLWGFKVNGNIIASGVQSGGKIKSDFSNITTNTVTATIDISYPFCKLSCMVIDSDKTLRITFLFGMSSNAKSKPVGKSLLDFIENV